MPKKNILIYGATGSIGNSTLNLIRNNREKFNVVGITCNENIEKVTKIAIEFNCQNVGIGNKDLLTDNKETLSSYNVHAGIEEFSSMVNDYNPDIIIFAISGTKPLNLLMELALSLIHI